MARTFETINDKKRREMDKWNKKIVNVAEKFRKKFLDKVPSTLRNQDSDFSDIANMVDGAAQAVVSRNSQAAKQLHEGVVLKLQTFSEEAKTKMTGVKKIEQLEEPDKSQVIILREKQKFANHASSAIQQIRGMARS